MIQVYKIPVPKEKLQAMPEDQRVSFLLLGYAANQLNFYTKIAIFCSNRDSNNETEQELSSAQTEMAVRLVIGSLHEAYNLIQLRFMRAPRSRLYTPLLDSAGQEAFTRLKKTFKPKNMFAKMRNAWIFHHPQKTNEVTQAFEDAVANPEWDKEWNWFCSHSGYNSFFFASEIVAIQGIARIVGETDLREEQKTRVKRVLRVAEDMRQLIYAIIAVLWRKYFGDELPAEGRIDITDAPGVLDVSVPFFVGMPSPSPADSAP